MTYRNGFMALALVATAGLATTAIAQPAHTDLGALTLGTPVNLTAQAVPGSTVIWYKFSIAADASFAGLKYLDIDTVGSTSTDTEVGLYSSTGAFITTDDDDAAGSLSALSYGTGSGLAAGVGGAVSNGRDGALAAGTYYLAVGLFNTTFNATAWNATSAQTSAGTVNVNLSYNSFTPPPAPTANLDFGALTSPAIVSGTLTGFVAGQVQWVKFTLPTAATVAGTGYLDIDTNGGSMTGTDSHIGLYAPTGQFLDSNDESGPSSYSSLSYGRTTPSRPGIAATGNATSAGAAHAGVNGASDITAGTYYLAVTGFGGNVYNNFWAATTTHTRTGDVAVRIEYVADLTSIPPAISASSTTPAGPHTNGDVVTLTATVVPGSGPASTGLAVTGNLTSIGGGASVAFLDNGVAPDATAGDNIFTTSATISGAVPGTASIPLTVTDAQARSGNGSGSVSIGQDLGTLTSGSLVSLTGTFAASEVKWYRFALPVNVADPANWFDVWTAPGTLSNSDSEIGIYTTAGALVNNDDDGGTGNYSCLSFGRTAATPPRARDGADVGLGSDGAISAGTYWLAVGAFNTTFGATNFGAVSTSTATGDIAVKLDYSENTVPTNPTGVGSTTGNFSICNTGTVLVTVTPGLNPSSTGIGVTADLTAFGLSATETLFDDGAHNDGAAGDNVFGVDVLVPGSLAEGLQTVNFSVSDAEARTSSGSVGVAIDRAGDLPATAGRATGLTQASTISGFLSPNDVDMYAICVADTTAFSASLVGGTTLDTQLFLFDNTGAGVAMNDDEPTGNLLQSEISGFTLPAGSTFFLAVVGYDRDPRNSANEFIWNDTPFDVVRAPDATVTAGTVVTNWDGSSTSNSTYTITLTNATTLCPGDLDDGNGLGTPDCGVDINDLLYFLAGFEAGSNTVDLDDGNGNGVKDCAVDINDLLFFLARFEGGC